MEESAAETICVAARRNVNAIAAVKDMAADMVELETVHLIYSY